MYIFDQEICCENQFFAVLGPVNRTIVTDAQCQAAVTRFTPKA